MNQTYFNKTISRTQAMKFWLKLGLISFGGPAGQIALMHKELVDERQWIAESRFVHALNYCMLLPGPEAQQLATYLGWIMHKTWGGIFAGLAFILPSLLLLIALSWAYLAYGDNKVVAGVFYGLKPAVAIIVFHSLGRMANRQIKHWPQATIALYSFMAMFIFNLAFPLILLGALGLNFLLGKINSSQHQPTAIEITNPLDIPHHLDHPKNIKRRSTLNHLLKVIGIGLALWLAPFSGLVIFLGWENGFTQMAWFFTSAALLTFGGAYAVLPYVYQAAIVHYHWLSPTQMIDGLALGESTPGPLIMIVCFVAFIGASTQGFLGAEHRYLAGVCAAVLVTWFTFLPSFIFVLAGAPFIEATHTNPKLSGVMSAISPAVIGVMANLALFFAYHILWPQGIELRISHIDLSALLIGTVAGYLLILRKWNLIKVLLVSGFLGLIKVLALAALE